MIDETTGGLVYELKKAGELGEGSAFTVRLEVRNRRTVLPLWPCRAAPLVHRGHLCLGACLARAVLG